MGNNNNDFLMHLIDVVWQEAHEDTSVPSTTWKIKMLALAKSDFIFKPSKTKEEIYKEKRLPLYDDGLKEAILAAMEEYKSLPEHKGGELYSKEDMEQCHMAGQKDAGCKEPHL